MIAESHDADRSPRESRAHPARGRGGARRAARARQSIARCLMNRCASGDHQALAELYELYSEYLLRLAKAVVRSPEEAEDVLQEVFLYVWRNAGRYNSQRSAVSTWLWQITRSRAIDHLRRSATRHKAHTRLSRWAATSLEPQAERGVLGAELRLHLGKALSKLPAAQQEALRMAYVQGMTQTEIAAESRTPLGTVKTRTYLAMRKLRTELEPDLLEAG